MLTDQEREIVAASRDNPSIAPVGRLMETVLSASRDWVKDEAARGTRGIDMGRAFAYVLGQVLTEVSLATGIQTVGLVEMTLERVKVLGGQIISGEYKVRRDK